MKLIITILSLLFFSNNSLADYSHTEWTLSGMPENKYEAKILAFDQSNDDSIASGFSIRCSVTDALISLMVGDILAKKGDLITWETDTENGEFINHRNSMIIRTDLKNIELNETIINAMMKSKQITFKNNNTKSFAKYNLYNVKNVISEITTCKK